jgi:steroid delta-isomerase-like uncharacterized protein
MPRCGMMVCVAANSPNIEHKMSVDLVNRYYAAFNAEDFGGMLALLTDDIAHDMNQGGRQVGLPAFERFMAHMQRCYRERLRDIVVMVSADGQRGAAEFVVDGEYLETDGSHPPAHGQRYSLAAGTFFEFREGRISRVTTYYNVPEWVRQVRGEANG